MTNGAGKDEYLVSLPAGLPVGKWNVEFANGVTQVCEVRKDGTASVVDPLRTAAGKATVKGNATVIVYERGGHSPHYTEPARFARELMQFIADHA